MYLVLIYVFKLNIYVHALNYNYIQQLYSFKTQHLYSFPILSIQKSFIHSTTFYLFNIYCASLIMHRSKAKEMYGAGGIKFVLLCSL